MFRFSLAELCVEQDLLHQLRNCEHAKIGELVNQIKFNCNRDHDLLRLSERAFRQTRIPNRKKLTNRRQFYCQQMLAARHARLASRNSSYCPESNELLSNNGNSSSNNYNNNSNNNNYNNKNHNCNDQSNEYNSNGNTSTSANCNQNESNKKSPLRRSNSPALSPPTSPSGWLRKSMQDLFRLSTSHSSSSNDSSRSNSFDSCNSSSKHSIRHHNNLVVSANHSKIALLQTNRDHSRIEVRDVRYCSIFYPNRRPSIVLSDSEQHSGSVCRLDATFDAKLLLVGVSNDAEQVLLCEPEASAHACTAFMDQGVRVWLFEVPGQVQFAFFNSLDWTFLTVDPVGRVTKLPLEAGQQPAEHVQQSEPFLLPSDVLFENESSIATGQLQMASLDSAYRLLWLYATVECNSTDAQQQTNKKNSQRRTKLQSLSLTSIALQSTATERFGRLWMRRLARLTRKTGSIEEEDQIEQVFQTKGTTNNQIDLKQSNTNRNKLISIGRRKSSGIELSGSDLDDTVSSESQPSVTQPSPPPQTFSSNDCIDSSDQTSSSECGSDDEVGDDAFEQLQDINNNKNNNKSSKLFQSKSVDDQLVDANTNKQHNQTKRIQRILVLDTVNLQVFSELRLNGTVQITQLVTAGGMAYCAHANGSVSMLSSGSDERSNWPLNGRKCLLQAQPDEHLIHLQVFDVSRPASLRSLVGEQLAESLKRKQSDHSQKSESLTNLDLSKLAENDILCSTSTANQLPMSAEDERLSKFNRSKSLDHSIDMIPPLPARLSHVRNSDILVVALYRSGKLHCIYTKNGCVQERKLTRLDMEGPEGAIIDRLQIVSALKMDWKDEDDIKMVKTNEDEEGGEMEENVEMSIESLNGNRARLEVKSNLQRSESYKLNESNEFKTIARRSSLSPNQCSYLVTLCSPSPNYRLINVKL